MSDEEEESKESQGSMGFGSYSSSSRIQISKKQGIDGESLTESQYEDDNTFGNVDSSTGIPDKQRSGTKAKSKGKWRSRTNLFKRRVSFREQSSESSISRETTEPRLPTTSPHFSGTRAWNPFGGICGFFGPRSMRGSTDSGLWDSCDMVGKSVADNISFRICERMRLLRRRRILVDTAFALAFLGTGFMMTETELFLRNHITKTSMESIALLTLVSLSTLLLLVVIVVYHVTIFQQKLVDTGLGDIRLLTTPRALLAVSMELIVCAVHPPPIRFRDHEHDDHDDSTLCVLMFGRLYLIGRLFLVHSNLVKDTSTRSLGTLNKVPINEKFVFKALMTERPGALLFFIMALIFMVTSWCVHACELSFVHAITHHNATQDWNNPVDPADVKGQYVLQAMWMSAITLLTVGYGDVTPYSTCGRLTAVVVGMLGVLITALLVAVMAQKLEQSRAEKYLHTFFSRMRMNRLYKNAAAHVIKSILMLWRLKHLPDGDRKYRKRLLCYGKLMQAVRAMRRWKVSKMQVGESAIGVIEVNAAVSDVHRLTEIITDQQSHLVERSDEMEDRLWTIENKLDHVAKTTQPSGVRIPSPFTLTSSISALSMESKSQGRSGFDVLDELSSAADMETTTAERLAEEYNYDIDDVKNKVKRLDLISREQILDTKRNKKLKKVVLVKKVDKKFLLGESEDFRLKYSFHEGKAVREYFGIGYSGYRATSSVEKADTLDLLLLEAVPQNDTRYKRVLEAIELDFRILRELVKLYAAYYLSKRR